MFWTILLCHFIADYPLQTDGMVVAKKSLTGLLMHVSIHFIIIFVMLCSFLHLSTTIGIVLALTVSLFHFVIDFWKNVLSQLRPDWVIFSYVQDQILHLLSIVLIALLWQNYSGDNMLASENSWILFLVGLVLVTHTWFVTERVISYQKQGYQQWVEATMWPRMMSRGMFYSVLLMSTSLSGFVLFAGSIIVVWNDLKPEKRLKVLALDLGGVLIFFSLAWIVDALLHY